MTAREMQREFEQSSNYIDAVQKGDIRLLSTDTEFFLNEAQHAFVNTRLKNFKNNIDNKQKDLDEIRTLLVKSTSLIQDVASSNNQVKVFNLPDNYNFLVADRTVTTFCNQSRPYQNRLLSSENLQEALYGTHTKPKFNSPISELIGSKLYVYRDFDLTFEINDVIIDYIRDWENISISNNITSELDENVHKDIVQLAVTLFLEAIESGRFRTNVEKNIITEQV